MSRFSRITSSFALVLVKDNEVKLFGGNELLDVANEGLRHRRHRRRRGKALAMMNPRVPHNGSHRLQVGHVNVEVRVGTIPGVQHALVDPAAAGIIAAGGLMFRWEWRWQGIGLLAFAALHITYSMHSVASWRPDCGDTEP